MVIRVYSTSESLQCPLDLAESLMSFTDLETKVIDSKVVGERKPPNSEPIPEEPEEEEATPEVDKGLAGG